MDFFPVGQIAISIFTSVFMAAYLVKIMPFKKKF